MSDHEREPGRTRLRPTTDRTKPLAAADVPRSPLADDVSTSHAPRLAIGSLLARRYRIERFVAAGGMGEVYEATDIELRSRLAVKTVRAQIEFDPDALDRVRREVQLARAVTAPNVCRIFDIGQGEIDGARVTFITMELLEGDTLHARLKAHAGPLPIAEALPLAIDILRGLEAVHRAGVVHRDLKAENVLLVNRDGRECAVITDFGIARAQRPDGDTSALTQEGMMIGSPAFMAPEQINGSRITARTDVFAVAAILWELVVGRWPLRGEDTVEIIRKVASEFPTAADIPPDIAPRWAEVIRKCRRSDPQDRFGSAHDVLTALTTGVGLDAPADPVAAELVPAPAPARAKRRMAAAGVAAIAVTAGAALWWTRRDAAPATANAGSAAAAHAPATSAAVATALGALDHQRARAIAAELPIAGAPDALGQAAYWQATAAAAAGDWPAATAAAARGRDAPGLPRRMRLGLEAIEQRAAGDLDAALTSLEALYTMTPDDPEVALRYAEALIALGNVAAAGKVLDTLAATPAGTSGATAARLQLDRATALSTVSGTDNGDLERTAEAARAAADVAGTPVIEGRALGLRALARLFLGRTDEAVADVTRALTLLEAVDDRPGLCITRRVSAVITYNTQADVTPVLPVLDHVINDCVRAGDDLGYSLALNVRGAALSDLGQIDQAREAYVASIAAAARAHRSDAADSRAATSLGALNMEIGAMNAAEEVYLALQARDALDRTGVSLLNMTELARLRGDLPMARSRFAAAVRQIDQSKSQAYRTSQYAFEAGLLYETGETAAARAALQRAEALAKASGSGSSDWNVISAKVRSQFAVDRREALPLLQTALTGDGLSASLRGQLIYLTARALVADGQRVKAIALRDANAADLRWPRYHEVQLMARLLDAELATTPAERGAATSALAMLREALRADGYTTARWEAEVGLARLARAGGDAAQAQTLADATAREAGAAGYQRLAIAARAAAGS